MRNTNGVNGQYEEDDDTIPEDSGLLQKDDDPYEKPSLLLWLAVLATSCGTFAFGFSLGFTSPTMNPEGANNDYTLDAEMNMSGDEQTWFGSVINLGAGFGAILLGSPVDRFGKRASMVAANALFIVGYGVLLSTEAIHGDGHNGSTMLRMYLSRIIMGFAIGLVCCSTGNYQTEVATLKLRGAIGTLFQVGVVMGIFMVYALGLSLRWRTLCIVIMAVNTAGMILCCFIPETPVWLISKGRNDEAGVALEKLRSKDSDIERLISNLSNVCAKEDSNEKKSLSDMFRDLTQPPRMKALAIGVSMMFVQQLSGVNAVMFYASYILGLVWTNPTTANNVAVGVQALQVFMTVVTAPLMDRAGRKILLVAASTGLVLSCGIMNMYFFDDSFPKALVVVGFYMYVASFSLGMGAIPWFIMGEIFHPDVKGLSSSIVTAVNWSLSFGITKTVQNLQSAFGGGNVGMGWVFTCYGAVCLLGIPFIIFFIPETKGKSYAVIEKELRGKSYYTEIDA